MSYLKTVFIEYPNGGDLFDALGGTQWKTAGTADATNPGVQKLMMNLTKEFNKMEVKQEFLT